VGCGGFFALPSAGGYVTFQLTSNFICDMNKFCKDIFSLMFLNNRAPFF
jgi:hypothetical protein